MNIFVWILMNWEKSCDENNNLFFALNFLLETFVSS